MASTRRGWASAIACSGLLLCLPSGAADVGGFFADQQKAREAAAAKGENSCPQWIASAARDNNALASYRAALCYLQADPADAVAAKAWLVRSNEQGFMAAQRLLRSMLIAEAGMHASTRHCHVLGEGQQFCHGGAPAPAAAATQ
jgi:hypothetical protein